MALSQRHEEHMDEQALIKQIVRELEQIGRISGQYPHTIFEDYLALTNASLDTLPLHIQEHAAGQVLRDFPQQVDPTIPALWARLRQRYHYETKTVFNHFGNAFGQLLQAAQSGWNDWLGSIFMQWELSNHWKGQFFTPWPVAKLMAQLTLCDIERLCHERVKAALLHPDNHLGAALLLGSCLIQSREEAHSYFVERLVPAALPYVEPIQIYEPAVGSGAMLLAAAGMVPEWANQYAIVQYYGQDVDELCVQMAQIQLKLYGLNGFGLRCLVAAQQRTVPVTLSSPAIKAAAELTPATAKQRGFRKTKNGFVVEKQAFEF
jgi:N-6 DNA Methylase